MTTGTNQSFSGSVEIELGGPTPGFGDGYHDQINDSGTITLLSDPELKLFSWNSYVPTIGDTFEIMTWQGGLDGQFGSVWVDDWFTDHGLSFRLSYDNVTGPGSLIVTAANAIPEPSTVVALLSMGLIGLFVAWRKRRKK